MYCMKTVRRKPETVCKLYGKCMKKAGSCMLTVCKMSADCMQTVFYFSAGLPDTLII